MMTSQSLSHDFMMLQKQGHNFWALLQNKYFEVKFCL